MIIIKTEKEIETIHEGGKLLAKILKSILKEIKPGGSTKSLEESACDLIRKAGGRPSFKGYKSSHDSMPYPTALCVSLNDEVVHAPALPERIFKQGDIVGIDIGMEFPSTNGFYTDMAATVAVGKISKEAKKLINVTKKSLEIAIKKIKPGASLYDVGKAVEDYVDSHGFSVVRDLVGHGVGIAVHEDPQIPNYAVPENKNIILKPGMVIAIEPMVNAGSYRITTAKDDMTIKTSDGRLSAHFEHTVAVTKSGHRILTA